MIYSLQSDENLTSMLGQTPGRRCYRPAIRGRGAALGHGQVARPTRGWQQAVLNFLP